METCRAYFFAKEERKTKFWGGGGEWWGRKMVEEYDIGWRVVETLLFWWEKPWNLGLFRRKKYSENRHFRVVFLL